MTDLEVYTLILVSMSLSLGNWRLGVLVCLAVGFLQDPMRKLLPGEPVVFTALVAAPLAMTLGGAYLRNVRLSFLPLHTWNAVLRNPLRWFILVVLLQSGAGFLRTGSLVVAGIGALSYLAPLPAILLGYQFSRSERDIGKVIRVYLIVCGAMTLTVYLAYAGIDWQVLKQVGEELYIYSIARGRLTLYSGLFRTPEIAAWHAATGACLFLLGSLAFRWSIIVKSAAGAMVLVLLGAILLTGRRKFLVEAFLFVSIYALMLIWFHRSAIKSALIAKTTLVLTGGLVAACLGYMYIATDVSNTAIQPYYDRGASVSNDVGGRVSLMTLESFQYVIAQNGILGSGAGTGSQGSQYFGGGSSVVGYAAEGGLGKVLAELGIPGLALLLWLLISLGRYIWAILQYITREKDADPVLSRLVFGLVSLLITNGFVFLIAHQVFGDPFVLIIMGLFLGFIMATPRMHMRKMTEERRRAKVDLRPLRERLIVGDRRKPAQEWVPVEDQREPVGMNPSIVRRRAFPPNR